MTFDELLKLDHTTSRTSELLITLQKAVLHFDTTNNSAALEKLVMLFPHEATKLYLLRNTAPFNVARTREVVDADLARLRATPGYIAKLAAAGIGGSSTKAERPKPNQAVQTVMEGHDEIAHPIKSGFDLHEEVFNDKQKRKIHAEIREIRSQAELVTSQTFVDSNSNLLG